MRVRAEETGQAYFDGVDQYNKMADTLQLDFYPKLAELETIQINQF